MGAAILSLMSKRARELSEEHIASAHALEQAWSVPGSGQAQILHIAASSATLLVKTCSPWYVEEVDQDSSKARDPDAMLASHLLAEIQDPPTPPATAFSEVQGGPDKTGWRDQSRHQVSDLTKLRSAR